MVKFCDMSPPQRSLAAQLRCQWERRRKEKGGEEAHGPNRIVSGRVVTEQNIPKRWMDWGGKIEYVSSPDAFWETGIRIAKRNVAGLKQDATGVLD